MIETRNQFNPSGIGVELGVAKGEYSDYLLNRSDLNVLYSIDRWAGDMGHGSDEYFKTSELLSIYGHRSTVLRMDFKEALSCFKDEFFDFIYIDGYAHTGQNGGETLDDWWPKLKPGGMFAGHDYDPEWSQTIKVVDIFVNTHKLKMNLTTTDTYNSWWVTKGEENGSNDS